MYLSHIYGPLLHTNIDFVDTPVTEGGADDDDDDDDDVFQT